MGETVLTGVVVSDNAQAVYDYVQVDAFSPSKVKEALEKANGQKVEFILDSPGGDLIAGQKIFAMLKNYKGETVVKVFSMAASAASVLMCGATKAYASPGAQIMIHEVSTNIGRANKVDYENTALALNSANQTVAAVYELKTGKPQSELLQLMNRETYFSAEQALQIGLVDGLLFKDDPVALAKMKLKILELKNKQLGV